MERTHVFDLVKEAYPLASIAMVADWENLLGTLMPKSADVLAQ